MLPIAPIHNGKQITFTAQLEITYPTEDGIETKTLTRRVDALVASDDYYLYATQYDDWQRARKVVETPLWIVLVVGSIAAVGGSVALIRRGAFQVVSTGSLIIEIRRQSGARRLGVEAHSLKKVDVDIDPSIERGVILGLVHAQSPAGRGGLRSGDVLVSLNDKAINSPGDLNRVAGRIKKGQSIPVTVLRDGEEIKLTIKF
jgi:membrane-associated protease RseP (regulator of RpoE activity)